MATFTNFVFDTTTQNPPMLGVGLSAGGSTGNSVVLDTINGYLIGYSITNPVVGVLFNEIPNAGVADVSLSASYGIKMRVNNKYHGSTFALYFADRSSTLFTVNTATTAAQVVTNPVNYDNRGPIEVRRFSLEG